MVFPFFPVGRAKFLSKRNLDTAHISPGEICGLKLRAIRHMAYGRRAEIGNQMPVAKLRVVRLLWLYEPERLSPVPWHAPNLCLNPRRYPQPATRDPLRHAPRASLILHRSDFGLFFPRPD